MKNKDKISLDALNVDNINMDIIKKTIKKLHKENKNDVPKYLDGLKKDEKVKEATYDNDFLKYML